MDWSLDYCWVELQNPRTVVYIACKLGGNVIVAVPAIYITLSKLFKAIYIKLSTLFKAIYSSSSALFKVRVIPLTHDKNAFLEGKTVNFPELKSDFLISFAHVYLILFSTNKLK